MDILKTKHLDEAQFAQINALWNAEYPLALKDRFPLLLDGLSHYTHYLIVAQQQVLAWAVLFEKDQETRFSIIVDQNHQRKGLGGLLIDSLKQDVDLFYGWVIDHNNALKANGQFYQTPLSFYRKHGFTVLTHQRIDTDMLKAVKIKFSSKG